MIKNLSSESALLPGVSSCPDFHANNRPSFHNWLVVPTHLKNISQNGNLPQIRVKKTLVWNHHLDNHGSQTWVPPNRIVTVQRKSQFLLNHDFWRSTFSWSHVRIGDFFYNPKFASRSDQNHHPKPQKTTFQKPPVIFMKKNRPPLILVPSWWNVGKWGPKRKQNFPRNQKVGPYDRYQWSYNAFKWPYNPSYNW